MTTTIDLVLRMIDRVSPSTNQIARNASHAGQQLITLSNAGKAAALTFATIASSKVLDFFGSAIESFASAES